MDFQHIYSNTQANMDLESDSTTLEAEANQNDVFYAELRRRILLLTEEEDDDDFLGKKYCSKSMGVAKQCSNIAALPPRSCFSWLENENGDSVPTWLLNLWRNNGNGNRNGNGTGVFIPHIVKSRRRHRPRKRNNDGGRTYRAVVNKNE